ncbi:hypothetical protein AB1Y20_018983 [Prymnesium parvum]|uniref:Double-strand-break repair protein rad21 homolog n=1 Tax=Prymnesium parvum TaxID=97485 RepID=A0AB34JQ04_PRYPA
MFYSQFVLAKRGPLGKIWLAAHMDKVPKTHIMSTNIPESVGNIENPALPMALRVSGNLLLGVVRIFSHQVTFLLTDCNAALVKIKDAFRAPGAVELPQGATTRRYEDITNPDQFDELDLETGLASQEMSFSFGGDDALAGISIPEVPLEGGEVGMAEEHTTELFIGGRAIDEQEGFGASDNFEVFFDTKALDDSPHEERRRRSDREDRTDERAAPEVEQFRSADEGDAYPMPALAPEDPAEELVQTNFDEPDEMMFEEAEEAEIDVGATKRSSLAAAMEEEPPLSPQSEEFSPQSEEPEILRGQRKQPEASLHRKGAKRRMVLDEQLELRIDRQLADNSSIVRDAAALASCASRRTAPSDPFSGPPSLPFLPSFVGSMACFQPQAREASLKRPRKAAFQSESFDDPLDEEEREEEPERWRLQEQIESQAHDEVPDSLVFEKEQKPEEDATQFSMLDEPDDMMQMEPEMPVGVDEAVPGFEGTHQLPDVDTSAESVLLTHGGGSGKANRKASSRADPEAWSKRTHNMYVVLGRAFEESDGQALSYDAMIAQTVGPDKRRIVAGCFQELLFLASKGLIDLEQRRPYANIIVSKTDRFETVHAS